MFTYLISPLDLKCSYFSIFLENIINLFSFFGSPKIPFSIWERSCMLVYLCNDKIFPQIPNITSKIDRLPIFDNCISHSDVIEVYLRALFEFITEISRESMQRKYDKRLLEKMNIFLNCDSTHTNLPSQFTIWHNLSNLQSKELEKSYNNGSLANPFDFKDIFW